MRNFEKNLKTTQKNTLKPLKHQIRRDLIWPHIILSHMRPKFSREGRVAGYLGQCPRFDRIFIFIASLIARAHFDFDFAETERTK